MTGPLDQPVTIIEMKEVWARVTRGHELRSNGTAQGIRDSYVMDMGLKQLEDIALDPKDFQNWATAKRNPPAWRRGR